MPDHAQPTWNRHLLSFDTAQAQLSRATFRLNLPVKARKGKKTVAVNYYGTGFFISSDGWALTAYHIFKSYKRKLNFDAEYRGEKVKLFWVKDRSSQAADIAVLRLASKPREGFKLDFVTAAYLDPSFSLAARRKFWGGRDVSILGYPIRRNKPEEERLDGQIDTSRPIIESYEGGGRVQRLSIRGSRVYRLGGISGAPVFDLDLGQVIAVEGSYSPDQQDYSGEWIPGDWDVRASELALLIDEFPQLSAKFVKVFGNMDHPEKGIAALTRPRGETTPVFAPISVRFLPSETPTGRISFDNTGIESLAREAVLWAGNYTRSFKGRLREVLEKNHWGIGKSYGCAFFHMPPADYEPLPSITAGMVLAYLARVFEDTLNYELGLSLEFPKLLFIAAAGFREGDNRISGAEGLSEACANFQFNHPAVILFARSQAQDLPRFEENAGAYPIDVPEMAAEKLLAELVKEIKSVAQDTLSKEFEEGLRSLLENEDSLKQAHVAGLGREARMRSIDIEITALEEQKAYLEAMQKEIREKLINKMDIPSRKEILEKFSDLRDKLTKRLLEEEKEAPEEIDSTIVLGQEEQEDALSCHKLFRRLAPLCHPDTEEKKNKANWFIALNEHRWERFFMDAMEGFLDPLAGVHQQSKVTDHVSDLFDRLFRLRDTKAELAERVVKLKDKVESVGEDRLAQMDEEIKMWETFKKSLEFDVGVEWDKVNRLLGRAPYKDAQG